MATRRRSSVFKWLELVVGVVVMFASVAGWFAYSKYVEVASEAQNAMRVNEATQTKLTRELEMAKAHEKSLQKLVDANIARSVKSAKGKQAEFDNNEEVNVAHQ